MAKLRVWIATNKVGSKCERTIEVDDEDLADCNGDKNEIDALLYDYAQDVLPEIYEWGYELLDDKKG